MARIVVDDRFCKGCGLCISMCPKKIIELDASRLTPKGYHPARCVKPESCIACASCYMICPDVAITVVK